VDYLVIKSLHLIFVVSWFAALFYIVRLFIYFVEAGSKPKHEALVLQDQFKVMQRKLWYIIGWSAMILTIIFGVWMLILNPGLLKLPWMHIKLGMVIGLIVYHLLCERILRALKAGKVPMKSIQLRLFNELATLFLVGIVFLVIMKDSLNWIYGLLGFFGTAIALMFAVQLYKKMRKNNA
jgi:putative membrane protein